MKKTTVIISILFLAIGSSLFWTNRSAFSWRNSYLIYHNEEPDLKTKAINIGIEKLTKESSLETLEQKRKRIEMKNVVIPKNMKLKKDTINGIEVEWIVPDGAPNDKVIYYIHGGGWSRGGLRFSRVLGTILARNTGFKVLTINYRLSPENPYPAALDDVTTVYHQLVKEKNLKIGVIGDSAGGNLTFALVNRLKESKEKYPKAVVGVSPATDLTKYSQLYVSSNKVNATYKGKVINLIDEYVGSNDRKNPLISPLYGDLKGLPPMLIHVGGREELEDDILAYSEKANSQGVDITCKIWRGMYHDFQMMDRISSISKKANVEIARFLLKQLK